jgi:thioesterase domain-containing protein
MNDLSFPVIVLPGAGGGAPSFAGFTIGDSEYSCFEALRYPPWQHYLEPGFSAEVLVDELAAQIVKKVPHGPIRIVGLSIGGHLGYAAALRLHAIGREIAGFCAIDSFMTVTSQASAGWKGRAISEGLQVLRKGRLGELARFARSKIWRALLRVVGDYLPGLLRRGASSGNLPTAVGLDPMLETELAMRLLIREVAPWLKSLDQNSACLMTPAVLLRTRDTACDDAAWRRRCPNIEIFEVPGQHHTLFEPENIDFLREAFNRSG